MYCQLKHRRWVVGTVAMDWRVPETASDRHGAQGKSRPYNSLSDFCGIIQYGLLRFTKGVELAQTNLESQCTREQTMDK